MRKVLSTFLVSSVLLLCAAPLFSFAVNAPFTINSTLVEPASASNKVYYVLGNSADEGVLIQLSSTAFENLDVSFTGGLTFANYQFGMAIATLSRGTYFIDVIVSDLVTGNLIISKSDTFTNTSYFTFYWTIPGNYNDSSYAYSPSGTRIVPSTFNHSDSFVNWFDPNNHPYVPPVSPSDPTDVIRSRIPRPFGTACTFYIADHLYLYSIFVGVPQQFEVNGYISDNDPNHFYSDNYNVFDVSFNSSGSSLNFTLTNRAEYSYNVIVTKYDVVDGSFVSSQPYAVVAATNSTTPGVTHFSFALSDPSTYGIYQSGFFARSHSVPYPELRISWSDTIDYSLDLFVIRSGLATIVEGINTTNTQLTSANSTLTAISSTSEDILEEIQSFYTLVSEFYIWFKGTFYDNLNSKWTFTNNYLVSIYNLLNETDETMEIEDDTSGVAAMESAKNDLVVTNASGQTVDAGNAAAVGLSEAAVQIGEIAQPVGTINSLMQTIVFDKPKLLLPVIVALGLGLMVTILGKNKSD